MKLSFKPPKDGRAHTYCISCKRESVAELRQPNGQHAYKCQSCGHQNGRALILDPAIRSWLDDSGEYWHEVAGVFVTHGWGRFLFFERLMYPYGLTVPAGHLDRFGETARAAAKRELWEETGIDVNKLTPIATDDIWGDSCRRGSDVHRWHSFAVRVSPKTKVRINEEGARPLWMTLESALQKDPTFATRYVIGQHASKLRKLAR